MSQVVDKSFKRGISKWYFHDIKGIQWVWSDHVRGYISDIGGYSIPQKLRENTGLVPRPLPTASLGLPLSAYIS